MHISRTTRVWFATVALAAGCGDDGNKEIDAPVHTNIDAPDIDAAPALATVHGTGSTHGIKADGTEVVVPRDFTFGTYAAYSPEGPNLVRNLGSGASDGTFTVPVVDGAHDWQLEYKASSQSAASVWVTSTTAPDLSSYLLGRLDAAFPAGETDLTLALTGMSAWGAQDSLQLFTPATGGIVFSPEAYMANSPAAGATTLTGTFDYQQQFQPLADGGVGDKTYVTQLVTKGTGATTYSALGRVGSSTDFTLLDSTPATLTLALGAVAQDQTFTAHWKRSQFEALGTTLAPGGSLGASTTQLIAIDALPQAAAHGFYNSAPDLALFFPAAAATDVDATFTYGNPFSTNGTPWEQFAIVQYQWQAPVSLNGTAPFQENVGFYGYAPLASFTGGTIAPPLSAVKSVTIAGKDLSTAQTAVGTSPTVAWAAPTTGTPTSYIVQLQALTSSASGTTAKVLANFYTKSPKLQIPAAYLATGATYVLAITAVATVGDDIENKPFEAGMPSFQVTMVTAQFKP